MQGEEIELVAHQNDARNARRPQRQGTQPDGAEHPGLAPSLSRLGQNSFRGVQRNASRLATGFEDNRHHMLRNAATRRQMMESQIQQWESDPDPNKRMEAARMKTFIVKQIEKRMEGHTPHFTRIITLVQLVIMACMLMFGDLADWGMGVVEEVLTVQLLDGTTEQPIARPENPYYGPEVETLVIWGSKWSPCMRDDDKVDEFRQEANERASRQGCCIAPNGKCGMLIEDNCEGNPVQGTWQGLGVLCSDLAQCDDNILIRPCCYGIQGQCAVLSEQHCDVLNGQWMKDSETCEDNKCIFEVCGMGYDEHGWEDKEKHPNQWYRFIVAIFLHVGVIHYLMNALGQYVLVSQVEFVAGFWRTALMYLLSGVVGFMISALFSAELLSNGSSAAIYGMLGVETVDLFKTWQLLNNKAGQLIGLIIKLVIFLGIGTLPYIDNFAHVGGFLGGVVTGLWLLPFMVFSRADAIRKRVCQVLAVVALGAVLVGMLAKFYSDGEIVCDFCHYINCVPYTSGSCDVEQEDVDTDIG